MDDATGLCRGCARTGEEVAAWQDAEPAFKLKVWSDLPPRRAALSLSAYRLPWSPDEIGRLIERTLRRRWGSWTLGPDGGQAPFRIGADDDAEIVSTPEAVTAITARGAIRLLKHPKTIAVAFGDASEVKGPKAVALILPRGRVVLGKGEAQPQGRPDVSAVCPAYRAMSLFDLGVAPQLAVRYYLRTDDQRPAASLHCGEAARVHDSRGADGAQDSPRAIHLIVETGLGRVEIFKPDAEWISSLSGARDELPDGWTLPRVFAPCALFYPDTCKSVDAFLDGHF